MKVSPKILFGLLVALVATQAHAMRWYSPSTGKWFSRDPVTESGFRILHEWTPVNSGYRVAASLSGPRRNMIGQVVGGEGNPYGFIMNAPVNSFDVLGLVARGGEMQMYCRQPCEDFRRNEAANDRFVPNAGIVCCGGVKFICTWAADNESNQRAKEIVKTCLKSHERIHLPSVECDQCAVGPRKPRNKKQDRAFCEEEMEGSAVAKSCFEQALGECGHDQQCVDRVQSWIHHEQQAYDLYRAMCNRFPK